MRGRTVSRGISVIPNLPSASPPSPPSTPLASHISGSVSHIGLLGLGIHKNVERILEATAVTVAVKHHHGWPVGDVAGFSITADPLSLPIAALSLSLSLSLTTREWKMGSRTVNHHRLIPFAASKPPDHDHRQEGGQLKTTALLSLATSNLSLSLSLYLSKP
ncbi:hypothetical protein Hanom_Chr01g00018021 [Helianthus anomalus]